MRGGRTFPLVVVWSFFSVGICEDWVNDGED